MTNKSEPKLSTSYSSTMRTPTTPGQADGSNVHTVRNGIPDTTPCLWYQLQTSTTGIVHMSTCATPASWHHMMINFYTQANGYAPKRPPRSSTSHSLPFHKGLQTWHRPETDQQPSSHLTERTTKNTGNHIIGQLPSLPRPHNLNVARIHCSCVELRPTTLGPVTHRQPTQWQLWHTQPIQHHHADQDFRQSMAHTPAVQPTRIYPTP